MAIPDAQSVADKWATRTANAANDYATGVANSDKDPTALAIAAGPRYLQGVQDAFNSGRWTNALRRAGKLGWQNGVATKGVQNFQNGVASSRDKVAAAFQSLLAYESNLQAKINSMPNVTDLDRENRMLAWIRGMRDYPGA